MSDFAAVIAAVSALAVAAGPSLFSAARPPARFTADATFVVEVRGQAQIDQRCQGLFGVPPAGMKTDACSIEGRAIMPNPCAYPDESYARMLCHEMAHVNGWSSQHEN
jgi:hypothetical protein